MKNPRTCAVPEGQTPVTWETLGFIVTAFFFIWICVYISYLIGFALWGAPWNTMECSVVYEPQTLVSSTTDPYFVY